MTLQEREQLAKRLLKAADYAEKEWTFFASVVRLSQQDVFNAFQRYRILIDAANDVYNFDFDKDCQS